MIQPVKKVQPVRFSKKEKEVASFKEHYKKSLSSYKEEQHSPSHAPTSSFQPIYLLDEEVMEEKPDYEKAMAQYSYMERKLSFEVKA